MPAGKGQGRQDNGRRAYPEAEKIGDAKAKAPAKGKAAKVSRTPLPDFANDDKITVVAKKNPYEKGTQQAARFALFKTGQTVGACLAAQKEKRLTKRRMAIRKEREAGHIKIGGEVMGSMRTCPYCEGTGLSPSAVNDLHMEGGYGPWEPGQPLSAVVRWSLDRPGSRFECHECKGIGTAPRWWKRLEDWYVRNDVGPTLGFAFFGLVLAFVSTGWEPLGWAVGALFVVCVIIGVWFAFRKR